MADLDSTAELIPINELEDILYNQDTFLNFINQTGNYTDVNTSSYINCLNELMNLILTDTNNIDEEVFKRINAINKKYNYDKTYNYLEYLLHTEKMLTINMIEDILNNEDTFNKFLEFPKNSEYFDNISLLDYLMAIHDYNNYAYKSSYALSNEAASRINMIKKVYSLEIKRSHKLKESGELTSLSPEMERKILSKIDFSKSRFAIARNLYTELNKHCTYDVTFAAYDQSMDNEISKNIYEKNAEDVTIDENNGKFEVVCSSWAKCYYSLLIKNGYKAEIRGKFHKYVVFDCDGTLIKADATNVFYSDVDKMSLDDITRCSLGLPTVGFTCLEKDKDISLAIEEADREHEYFYNSKEELIRDAASLYANTYMVDKKRSSMEDKINYIESLVKNSELGNLELTKYINIIVRGIISYEEGSRVRIKTISVRENEKHFLGGLLLSIKNPNDEFEFITIDKENGVTRYSREEVIDKLNNNDLTVISKNKEIFGLESEINYGPNK